MSPEGAVGVVILIALTVYTLTGGADFGGGVWDLLARGPRKEAQRNLIAHAIGPIWEANHVWLIVIIVLLFACFPLAFAALSTALHIPLLLMLIGIVLRGSAFVFRSYGTQEPGAMQTWGRIFAIASVATPVMLGVTLGANVSGAIVVDASGAVVTDFVSEWLAPFPFAVGGLTLSLFSFLAAVYLIHETNDEDLRADFRKRALWAAVALGVFAAISLVSAKTGATWLWESLTGSSWAIPFQALTGASAVGAMWALYQKRDGLARALAVAQVVLIIAGLGLSQYPFIVPPGISLSSSAAPREVIVAALWVLGVGAVLLVPAFVYLYRVFKSDAL